MSAPRPQARLLQALVDMTRPHVRLSLLLVLTLPARAEDQPATESDPSPTELYRAKSSRWMDSTAQPDVEPIPVPPMESSPPTEPAPKMDKPADGAPDSGGLLTNESKPHTSEGKVYKPGATSSVEVAAPGAEEATVVNPGGENEPDEGVAATETPQGQGRLAPGGAEGAANPNEPGEWRILNPDLVPDEIPPLDDVVAVGSSRGWGCSGVVVAPRVVLTARHCLPATRVALGPSLQGQPRILRVQSSRAAPDRSLDAALLFLEAPTEVAPRITRMSAEDAPPEGDVMIVGFGVTSPDQPETYGLRRLAQVQVSGWGCDGDRAQETGCIPGRELVLTDTRSDTCAGDSGGPVLEPIGDGWQLLGLTSRALAPGESSCGSGGIYTRADVLFPWLQAELRAWHETGS